MLTSLQIGFILYKTYMTCFETVLKKSKYVVFLVFEIRQMETSSMILPGFFISNLKLDMHAKVYCLVQCVLASFRYTTY